MNHFYSSDSVKDVTKFVGEAMKSKNSTSPKSESFLKGKTMAMLFFNSSLRTRMSTEIAARKLGLEVICMDMSNSWGWEIEEGVTMDQNNAEHIKDAAKVISSYADIIGIRSFAGLKDKSLDYQDTVLQQFMKYSSAPVINLESSILHPLQSLADMMTIAELKKRETPKIVLSWAPHPKALPQAVSNSFLQWAGSMNYTVTVTHPTGYELDGSFMKGHMFEAEQEKAFVDADFIYVKNWSAMSPYGKVLNKDESWMITEEKMKLTNTAKFMHCMPIRRNVVATDEVLDGKNNAMFLQAENRIHAAKAVLSSLKIRK